MERNCFQTNDECSFRFDDTAVISAPVFTLLYNDNFHNETIHKEVLVAYFSHMKMGSCYCFNVFLLKSLHGNDVAVHLFSVQRPIFSLVCYAFSISGEENCRNVSRFILASMSKSLCCMTDRI